MKPEPWSAGGTRFRAGCDGSGRFAELHRAAHLVAEVLAPWVGQGGPSRRTAATTNWAGSPELRMIGLPSPGAERGRGQSLRRTAAEPAGASAEKGVVGAGAERRNGLCDRPRQAIDQ